MDNMKVNDLLGVSCSPRHGWKSISIRVGVDFFVLNTFGGNFKIEIEVFINSKES